MSYPPNTPHGGQYPYPQQGNPYPPQGTPYPYQQAPAQWSGSPQRPLSPDQVGAAWPSTAQDPGQPTTPPTRKSGRGLVVALVLLLVAALLGVGGFVGYRWLDANRYGPQATVESYLQALIDGDASEALALFGPNVMDSQRLLMSDEVYKASSGRPTSYAITSSSVSQDGAVVDVRFTQEGKEYTTTFALSREGTQAGVFSTWRIHSGPTWGSLGYARGATSTVVNGVPVDLTPMATLQEAYYGDPPAEEAAYPLLPGTYTVSAPTGTTYTAYGQDWTGTSSLDSGMTVVAFVEQYTDAVITDATAQLMSTFDGCLEYNKILLTSCRIASWDYSSAALTDIRRSWAEEPRPMVLSAEDADSAEPLTQPAASSLNGDLVVVIYGGEIKLDFKYRYYEDSEWSGDFTTISPFVTDSWDPLQLPVTIDGDTLTVDTTALEKVHSDWVGNS